MGEYIDRVEYCEKHCRCSNEYCDRQSCPIWKAPAADVAKVVHGRWIEKTAPGRKIYFECSHCGAHENKHTEIKGYYCWRCGAKMDGGVIDADALIADSCKDCPEEIRKLCKDCKYTGGDFVCYRGVMVQHKPEDFCSYGKRRGGGEDG